MMKRALIALIATIALTGTGAEPLTAQEAVYYRVHRMEECGRLGIAFAPADDGLLIQELIPGSPADRAGLRPGDVVIHLNGRPASPVQLDHLARSLEPGTVVQLRVQSRTGVRDLDVKAARDLCPRQVIAADAPEALHRALARLHLLKGSLVRLDTLRIDLDTALHSALARHRITVDSVRRRLQARQVGSLHLVRPAELVIIGDDAPAPPPLLIDGFGIGRRAIAGAEFSELNQDLAQYFGGVQEGLLALKVAPETPSARAGLRPGDIVTTANGRPVRSIADLRASVAGPGTEPVTLEIVRHGRRQILQLPRGH